MKIIINGQPENLPETVSIEALLKNRGYEPMTVAVAHNGNFVPRGQREDILVQSGDTLEIVAPMQGG